MSNYPYPDNPGQTHWEGCWRSRGHHNCAIAEIERLTQERDAWRAATGLSNLTPEQAGAQIDADDDEIERLRAELKKYPHTEDGVPITPGLRVYWKSMDPKSLSEGAVVVEMYVWQREEGELFNGAAWAKGTHGLWALPDDFGLYADPSKCTEVARNSEGE